MAQDFPELLLAARRVPIKKIFNDGVDDFSVLARLAPDAGCVVNHDHRQGDRHGKEGCIKTAGEPDAVRGCSNESGMGGGHTSGAQQQRPVPRASACVLDRQLENLCPTPG